MQEKARAGAAGEISSEEVEGAARAKLEKAAGEGMHHWVHAGRAIMILTLN